MKRVLSFVMAFSVVSSSLLFTNGNRAFITCSANNASSESTESITDNETNKNAVTANHYDFCIQVREHAQELYDEFIKDLNDVKSHLTEVITTGDPNAAIDYDRTHFVMGTNNKLNYINLNDYKIVRIPYSDYNGEIIDSYVAICGSVMYALSFSDEFISNFSSETLESYTELTGYNSIFSEWNSFGNESNDCSILSTEYSKNVLPNLQVVVYEIGDKIVPWYNENRFYESTSVVSVNIDSTDTNAMQSELLVNAAIISDAVKYQFCRTSICCNDIEMGSIGNVDSTLDSMYNAISNNGVSVQPLTRCLRADKISVIEDNEKNPVYIEISNTYIFDEPETFAMFKHNETYFIIPYESNVIYVLPEEDITSPMIKSIPLVDLMITSNSNLDFIKRDVNSDYESYNLCALSKIEPATVTSILTHLNITLDTIDCYGRDGVLEWANIGVPKVPTEVTLNCNKINLKNFLYFPTEKLNIEGNILPDCTGAVEVDYPYVYNHNLIANEFYFETPPKMMLDYEPSSFKLQPLTSEGINVEINNVNSRHMFYLETEGVLENLKLNMMYDKSYYENIVMSSESNIPAAIVIPLTDESYANFSEEDLISQHLTGDFIISFDYTDYSLDLHDFATIIELDDKPCIYLSVSTAKVAKKLVDKGYLNAYYVPELPSTELPPETESTTTQDTSEIIETGVSGGQTTWYEVDYTVAGDANDDGVTDIRDVTSINQYILKIDEFTEQQLSNSDVIRDGIIDVSDLGQLKKYVLKLVEMKDLCK